VNSRLVPLLMSCALTLFIAVCVNSPLVLANRMPSATALSKTVNYRGISFTYDNSLATSVVAQVIPSHTNIGYPYSVSVQFSFDGYAAAPTSSSLYFASTAQIVVYDANDLSRTLMKVFPDTNSLLSAMNDVTNLRDLLKRHPDLSTVTILPGLPLSSRAVFHAKSTYIDFRNGTGISYIGHWAQQSDVVTNGGGLIYAFQGLTNDGHDYVCAIFPINVDSLPNRQPNWNQAQYTKFTAHYNAYVATLIRTLNSSGSNHFHPNLNSLYALVRSLTVHTVPVGTIPTNLALYVNAGPPYTGANLRSETSEDSRIFLVIPNGTRVQAEAVPLPPTYPQQWYKVTYQGMSGYVLASLLSPTPPK